MGAEAGKVMPRTWVCCPSIERPTLARPGGYTLLEMLVVLVLLSLAIGTVGPAVSNWMAAARERGWLDDLKSAVDALPLKAFLNGQPLLIDGAELDRLVPGRPPGVTLEVQPVLVYQANGMAAGGLIRIQGPRAQTWRILPLTGEVLQE